MFQNIRQVILAEQWCRDQQLPAKVIPVPKPWSSECGMCLETTRENADRLERFAVEQGIVTHRITPHKHNNVV